VRDEERINLFNNDLSRLCRLERNHNHVDINQLHVRNDPGLQRREQEHRHPGLGLLVHQNQREKERGSDSSARSRNGPCGASWFGF